LRTQEFDQLAARLADAAEKVRILVPPLQTRSVEGFGEEILHRDDFDFAF
jgi:hypothetical protein